MEIGPSGGSWRTGALGRRRAAVRTTPVAGSSQSRNDGRDDGRRSAETREEARGLVPVTVAEPREEIGRIVRFRSFAPFVAQLIAARDGHPDQRARRRADPAVAADLYEETRDRPRDLRPGFLVKTAL